MPSIPLPYMPREDKTSAQSGGLGIPTTSPSPGTPVGPGNGLGGPSTTNPLDVLNADAKAKSEEAEIVSYVVGWYNKLSQDRNSKYDIWNDCWALYRGKEDFSNKEDWHSKIVLPKSFNSVKKATSVIKRYLSISQKPWSIESIDPDNIPNAIKGEQIGQAVRVFMENGNYQEKFAEALESSFITGLGVIKVWWSLDPRTKFVTKNQPAPDGSITKSIVKQEVVEGNLAMEAVDPYHFYWLPGSTFSKFKGTVEKIRIPKWELIKMKQAGAFPQASMKDIEGLGAKTINDAKDQRRTRFDETPTKNTNSVDDYMGDVELLEYYGPTITKAAGGGRTIKEKMHIVVGGSTLLMTMQKNPHWHSKPPYVAFSPLSLPFRTEGMGLVEMVREIDKALNQLTNLSMDTLLFRLLPIFEVTPEVFENERDFETGLTPGKFFRRSMLDMGGGPGIVPIRTEDISAGAVQIAGLLDRAHQEGSLISEIQQGMPRYRGAQSAAESKLLSASQEGFFGSMAADIEHNALGPLVEMCMDTMLQNLDTSSDPRIPSILGINARAITTLTREELHELVQGDYTIKVTGISSQLEKAKMLESLVQFMNILGQNQEAWMPYINQGTLLRRILEVFRPGIEDIEDIIETPEIAQAKIQALKLQQLGPDTIKMLPGLAAGEQKQQQAAQQAQLQQQLQAVQIAQQQQQFQLDQQLKQVEALKTLAEIDQIYEEIDQDTKPKSPA